MSDGVKATERIRPLARRRWWPPLAVIAALLLVCAMWFARRPGTERVVRVEAAPRVVTVPVMVPVPPPPASPPATPQPGLAPPARVQVRAKPLAPTVAPAPVAAAPAAPSDVTTRYREVGQLLKVHGTDDLWRRYRWIRLGDCLTTDAKRADCVRMLDAIASDAAGK